MRQAANPVRKLTVSAAPLAVDQRGLIGRDSCSPLDPGPESPVHHHFQRLPHLQPTQPRTQLPAPRQDRPQDVGVHSSGAYRRPPRCSNACAASSKSWPSAYGTLGGGLVRFHASTRRASVGAWPPMFELSDPHPCSATPSSPRRTVSQIDTARSSGKLCELGPSARGRACAHSANLSGSIARATSAP